MKPRFLIISGIFLMIFGIDGILFLDSAVPECRGFTGMGLFVFVTLGFDSRAILSNSDCLESFVGKIIGVTLFAISLGIMIEKIIKRQNSLRILKFFSLKKIKN